MADVEELDSGPPHEVAPENAKRKASDVAATEDTDALVLGVDTVVALGDRLYGKPSAAQWSDGDFTGDGAVNFADLLVLAQNYGSSSSSVASQL